MDNFIQKLKLVISDSSLRNRILFVLFSLAIFRLLANIPIPAAAGFRIDELLSGSQTLGFLNLLTGGGLSAVSIVTLILAVFIWFYLYVVGFRLYGEAFSAEKGA